MLENINNQFSRAHINVSYNNIYNFDFECLKMYLIVAIVVFLAVNIISLIIFKKNKILFGPIFIRNSNFEYKFPFIIAVIILIIMIPTLKINAIHHMEDSYLFTKTEHNYLNVLLKGLKWNHFPLYLYLLNFISYFSTGIFTYRFFSLFSFVISFFPFYNLVAILTNSRLAKFSLVMFALSPLQLYYARSAEPYALFSMFSVLFLYYCIRNIQNNRYNLRLLLVAILGSYTHQFFFLLVAGFLISKILLKKQKINQRNNSSLLCLYIILVSPLIIFEIIQIPLFNMLFLHQRDLNYYNPFFMNPFISSCNDFLCLIGINFFESNKVLVYSISLMILYVCIKLTRGVLVSNKTVEVDNQSETSSGCFLTKYFIILTLITLCLYNLINILYQYHFSINLNGTYPLWRHGIFLSSLLITLLVIYIYNYKLSKKILYIIIMIQLISFPQIVYQKQFPDTKKVWELITSEIQDGDAVISLPCPTFLTPGYYLSKMGLNYSWYPDWITFNDKKLYNPVSDLLSSYQQIIASKFIKRIWVIKYNYKYFGIRDEFNTKNSENLTKILNKFRNIKSINLFGLSIQLFENSNASTFTEKYPLSIKTKLNDYKYLRNVEPPIAFKNNERLITENTEILINYKKGDNVSYNLILVSAENEKMRKILVVKPEDCIQYNNSFIIYKFPADFKFNIKEIIISVN